MAGFSYCVSSTVAFRCSGIGQDQDVLVGAVNGREAFEGCLMVLDKRYATHRRRALLVGYKGVVKFSSFQH